MGTPLPLLSQFGDVPMTILWPSSEPNPDWTPNLQMVTFKFPGDSATETQILGNGLMNVEYDIGLGSVTAFRRLLALLGTEQTMRVPHGLTFYRSDRVYQQYTEVFKEFDGVLLTALTDVHFKLGGLDGLYLCRCSFQRKVIL